VDAHDGSPLGRAVLDPAGCNFFVQLKLTSALRCRLCSSLDKLELERSHHNIASGESKLYDADPNALQRCHVLCMHPSSRLLAIRYPIPNQFANRAPIRCKSLVKIDVEYLHGLYWFWFLQPSFHSSQSTSNAAAISWKSPTNKRVFPHYQNHTSLLLKIKLTKNNPP
jgi:hypothetical protein